MVDKDSNDVLASYYDVDWVGNADDRKNTSSGSFYLGNNLISWMSKKQNSISLSTVEGTLLLVVGISNSFGCKNFFLTIVFVKNISPFTMTIPMPLISLKIMFNTLSLNT